MAAESREFVLELNEWMVSPSAWDLYGVHPDHPPRETLDPSDDEQVLLSSAGGLSDPAIGAMVDRQFAAFPRRAIPNPDIDLLDTQPLPYAAAPSIKVHDCAPVTVPVLSPGFRRQVILELPIPDPDAQPKRVTLTGEKATSQDAIAWWSQVARVVSDKIIYVSPERDAVAAFKKRTQPVRYSFAVKPDNYYYDPDSASLTDSLQTDNDGPWQAPEDLNVSPRDWVEAEFAAQSLVDLIKSGRKEQIARDCTQAERHRALVPRLACLMLRKPWFDQGSFYGITIEALAQAYGHI